MNKYTQPELFEGNTETPKVKANRFTVTVNTDTVKTFKGKTASEVAEIVHKYSRYNIKIVNDNFDFRYVPHKSASIFTVNYGQNGIMIASLQDGVFTLYPMTKDVAQLMTAIVIRYNTDEAL